MQKKRPSGRCELCTLLSAQPLVFVTFNAHTHSPYFRQICLQVVFTHVDDSCRSKAFICVCLCVWFCVSVCPQHNSISNNPKVFKLSEGNNLRISYKWYSFQVKRSKVKVTGLQSTKTCRKRSSGRRECTYRLVLTTSIVLQCVSQQNHCCNKITSRSTQPGHPSMSRRDENQQKLGSKLAKHMTH